MEDSFISCRGEDVNNAIRRAPLYMEKIVKAMHDGIASSYVSNLKKCRALSHIVEIMRAMQ